MRATGWPPATPEEHEAIATRGLLCNAGKPGTDWFCTREPGHDGPHVMAGTQYVYAKWEQMEERNREDR